MCVPILVMRSAYKPAAVNKRETLRAPSVFFLQNKSLMV